ncbi:hypothetical protein [Sphingomonas chungangi]|nr:hypothetical protein [Sphingomonas chungangi]
MRLFKAPTTRPSERAALLFAVVAALIGLFAMYGAMAWSLAHH